MIRFATEQTIERSADAVWTYAADIRRHPEWMGVLDARVVRGAGPEVGTLAIERLRFGPRTIDVEVTVTEAAPGERLRWTVAGGSPLSGDVTLALDPLGPERTHATWSGAIGLRGLWKILEPLMAAEVADGEAAELRRLKANVEAGASDAHRSADRP